jgi:hypothetical protein
MTGMRIIGTAANRIRLAALLLLTSAAFLAVAGEAKAIDADGNGYHDALVREMPNFPSSNVGAMCTESYSYGTYSSRLTVRPPRVWSLWGQYNQTVAWKARFYNVSTFNTEADTPWTYSTASPSQHTDFGGGGSAPQVWLSSSQYWAGSKWVDHPMDTTPMVKAVVDVAWRDARNGSWTVRTLGINYYYASFNGVVQPSATLAGC